MTSDPQTQTQLEPKGVETVKRRKNVSRSQKDVLVKRCDVLYNLRVASVDIQPLTHNRESLEGLDEEKSKKNLLVGDRPMLLLGRC